ncbi:hypothetical protein B0H11DRAFT_2324493, partial [Mycena galericulata]
DSCQFIISSLSPGCLGTADSASAARTRTAPARARRLVIAGAWGSLYSSFFLLACSLLRFVLPLPLVPPPCVFLSFLPSLPSSPRTTHLPPPPNPTQSPPAGPSRHNIRVPVPETQSPSMDRAARRQRRATLLKATLGFLHTTRDVLVELALCAAFDFGGPTSVRHTCLSAAASLSRARARQYSPRAAPSCPFRRPLPIYIPTYPTLPSLLPLPFPSRRPLPHIRFAPLPPSLHFQISV